ncbi:MAG: hypothetical protein V8S24_03090 [Gordonibacter pamelaeae]
MKSSSAFAWARGQFVSESGSIASARGSSNAASCGVSDAAMRRPDSSSKGSHPPSGSSLRKKAFTAPARSSSVYT